MTLDDIYAEQCREFTWETWHRNDMIRFGKFEGSWGIKTDKDVTPLDLPDAYISLYRKYSSDPKSRILMAE